MLSNTHTHTPLAVLQSESSRVVLWSSPLMAERNLQTRLLSHFWACAGSGLV